MPHSPRKVRAHVLKLSVERRLPAAAHRDFKRHRTPQERACLKKLPAQPAEGRPDGGDDLKLTANLPAELPIRLKIPSDCRLPELGPEHGTCKVRAGSQVVAVTI